MWSPESWLRQVRSDPDLPNRARRLAVGLAHDERRVAELNLDRLIKRTGLSVSAIVKGYIALHMRGHVKAIPGESDSQRFTRFRLIQKADA
jgi:hypothetical protein